MNSSYLYYFFGLQLNGRSYQFKVYHKIQIQDLINFFGDPSKILVLEYNGKICPRKNWSQIALRPYDQVEIVTIVGGG